MTRNHEKISKKKNSIYAIAIKRARAVTAGANRHSLTFTDAVKSQIPN
ncbi:hypothetical protein [Nostoc sp.]